MVQALCQISKTAFGGSSVEHGGVGYCCLAELRMYEAIEGKQQTPFMQDGDVVRIEMFDETGESIFWHN